MQGKSICVNLGRKDILHDVNFKAGPGQVTAIIGPNGSGKSTLLKTLAGEIGTSGTVTLNGHDISALKPWQLAAMRGVLPQSTSVAFPFKVHEIVRLGLVNGLAAIDDELTARALAHVDLAGFEDRSYQTLSGGEQQRVQLARVLTQVWETQHTYQPRWLLLDEPVASLDIAHQLAVLHIAGDFAAAGGGVVVVMHDLNLTALFADCVYVLSQGYVWGSGTPSEVLNIDLMQQVYGIDLPISKVPKAPIPFVLPQVMRKRLGA